MSTRDRQKINAEQINSQQNPLILMVKREQPLSQQLITPALLVFLQKLPVLQINHQL